MANISVNTQSVAYQNRHQQFQAIVVFWKPLLVEYFKLNKDQRTAWRTNDPFLNDLLRFARAVELMRDEDL